ncbi:AraC family transcriptional regulator [Paenibacillus athensensis]|nr:helix-turn-helix domain-containing protein [Paenibacillus athensensis]MCD1260561.1 AraC family transcriptional regulator [Paenibacillus athensensis]
MHAPYPNHEHAITLYHNRTLEPQPFDFHLHQDLYEIYFFLSGDVHYFIEKQVYPLQHGDLLVMNSNELHRPNFRTPRQRYEVLVIHFDPRQAARFSSPHFDLLHCFTQRPPGENNRLRLNPHQIEDILRLYERMKACAQPDAAPGADILYVTAFIELLVFINQAFSRQDEPQKNAHIPEKLSALLAYIDGHLDQDLSLETLESTFFMNRSYLCRLFKKHTGSTIHEHILFKRIARAKSLLREGSTVTDACQLSGFNDYSNFIRTFKKAVGLPPRQYQALNGSTRS